jgi:hypothetical protein
MTIFGSTEADQVDASSDSFMGNIIESFADLMMTFRDAIAYPGFIGLDTDFVSVVSIPSERVPQRRTPSDIDPAIAIGTMAMMPVDHLDANGADGADLIIHEHLPQARSAY